MMPKVTVLLPTYNDEKYIAESLESIINQTFRDIEILIINDGSTDRTREIVSNYADSRIVIVDNITNLGVTKSLNKGLKLATGEYIARQDADDISELTRIEVQISYLEDNPDVVLVGSGYYEIDSDGNLLGQNTLPIESVEVNWGLMFFTPFIHSAVTYRKDLICERIGLYNEDYLYAQDHELWSRIAKIGNITNLPDPLVKYRNHNSSITLKYSEQQEKLLDISRRLYMQSILNCESHSSKIKDINNINITCVRHLLGYHYCEGISYYLFKEAVHSTYELRKAFFNFYSEYSYSEKKMHLYNITRSICGALTATATNHVSFGRFRSLKLLLLVCRYNPSVLFHKLFYVSILKTIKR